MVVQYGGRFKTKHIITLIKLINSCSRHDNVPCGAQLLRYEELLYLYPVVSLELQYPSELFICLDTAIALEHFPQCLVYSVVIEVVGQSLQNCDAFPVVSSLE